MAYSRLSIRCGPWNAPGTREKGLRANGFTTTVVADGPGAVALARDDDFDLLILDLGLPGLDGIDVLKTLRGHGQRLPVLILSARDDVSDKVHGLELGADDYVTKPFRFEELLARVRVRLRGEGTREQTVLRAGGVALDLRTRRASVDGRTVDLSAREFTMLETFVRHADQVLSREQLLSHVWGYDFDPGSTSSTSTSATCAASSARATSRRCGASGTGSCRRTGHAPRP